MLLIAAGSLWLFLAAVPAFADGGPHVAAINNGTAGINADSCAGCHRAHRAQGEYLLAESSGIALCTSCHGAAGLGATTDVESGVQYSIANDGTRTQPVLGALRNGGFVEARIGSAEPYRIAYVASHGTGFHTKVSVLASGQPVTSAHLDLDGSGGVVTTGVAWGNIAGTPGETFDANPNPGGTVSGMTCTTCHNPHGNGKYRILNPIPEPETETGDTFAAAPSDVAVADAALPAAGDTRNYTVIQTQGGAGTLYASQVEALGLADSTTSGDYLRNSVPWDPQVDYLALPPAGATSKDAPNGDPDNFTAQMTAWCAQCHSRYLAMDPAFPPPQNVATGDAIFNYRHGTYRTACTTCHVAHGSNAAMTGTYSSDFSYPGEAITSASSRLLKIDNRGTCQACHDPTGTVEPGQTTGTVPVPYVP